MTVIQEAAHGASRADEIWRRLVPLGVVLFALACTPDTRDDERIAGRPGPGGTATPGRAAGETRPTALEDVVAQAGGETLSRAELDAPLRIALYELEVSAHRLRRARRDAWLRSRLGPDADVAAGILPGALAEPRAPRFPLVESDARMAGDDTAAIVVTHFVDFASSHSRRLEPVLATIAARYPGHVRVEDRQLPLPFHRHARAAAEAARCALEQSAYAPYAETLLLEQAALAEPDLRAYAAREGLVLDRFDACRAAGAAAADVDRDLALARSIGVERAATVLVNGRYVSGRPDLETLDRIVVEEGEGLGLSMERVAARGDAGRATHRAAPVPSAPRTGPPPVPDALFEDPAFVRTLGAGVVAGALAEAEALEAALEPSRSDFAGERLLSIRDVEPDGFYDRLGLEEGDVLFAVDGEFVTQNRNPFFEAMARGGVVRLLVMRRGLPVPMEIRIAD